MQNNLAALCAFSFPMNCNLVVSAKTPDSLLCPGKACCRVHPQTIENGRDTPIWADPSEVADQLFGFSCSCPTGLSDPVLRYLERSVITAFPMQLKQQPPRLGRDDDFFEHRAQNSLARSS